MRHTLINTVREEPLAFSGCSHGPATALKRGHNAAPIFVNGVEIAESDIAREAQNHSAGSGPEARAAAAQALVIRELLLQRGRGLGLSPKQHTDAAGREETREEALIRSVLEAEAHIQEPTEAECRRLYENALSRFMSPELYEASHILFAPAGEEGADWAASHDQAQGAIAALAAGADFATLARTHSSCPTAGDGGSLGQLQQGDLASEIETALLALDEGKVAAAPVRTRHGWHVVRLDRSIAPSRIPFEAVAPMIRARLCDRAWAAASARYVATLASAANIEGIALKLGGAG